MLLRSFGYLNLVPVRGVWDMQHEKIFCIRSIQRWLQAVGCVRRVSKREQINSFWTATGIAVFTNHLDHRGDAWLLAPRLHVSKA